MPRRVGGAAGRSPTRRNRSHVSTAGSTASSVPRWACVRRRRRLRALHGSVERPARPPAPRRRGSGGTAPGPRRGFRHGQPRASGCRALAPVRGGRCRPVRGLRRRGSRALGRRGPGALRGGRRPRPARRHGYGRRLARPPGAELRPGCRPRGRPDAAGHPPRRRARRGRVGLRRRHEHAPRPVGQRRPPRPDGCRAGRGDDAPGPPGRPGRALGAHRARGRRARRTRRQASLHVLR